MRLARDNKRDTNEREIIDALKCVGAKVIQLDRFDLLVNYKGKIFLIEVKSKAGKLTESQKELIDDGWPLNIVRTVEQAYNVIGAHVK